MSNFLWRVAKFISVAVAFGVIIVGLSCTDSRWQSIQPIVQAVSPPTKLLSIFALTFGTLFVLLLVFGRRGIWWAAIDTICIVGLLSLVLCPIYGTTSGQWSLAFAIGVSGLLAFGGTFLLYRRFRTVPEKKPIFTDEESGNRSTKKEENK
ncbi:MAG: hypothetical protein V1738_00590 [Patescibacteria group bacterium]